MLVEYFIRRCRNLVATNSWAAVYSPFDVWMRTETQYAIHIYNWFCIDVYIHPPTSIGVGYISARAYAI